MINGGRAWQQRKKQKKVNYSLEKVNNFISSFFKDGDEFETKDLEIKKLDDFIMFNLAFVYRCCEGISYKVEQDYKNTTNFGAWTMCNLVFRKVKGNSLYVKK